MPKRIEDLKKSDVPEVLRPSTDNFPDRLSKLLRMFHDALVVDGQSPEKKEKPKKKKSS